MIVWAGGRLWSSDDGPIAVVLTPDDRKSIGAMLPEATTYLVFDHETTTEAEADELIVRIKAAGEQYHANAADAEKRPS